MTNGNGYTQKELLNMVIERLDKIEDKLDSKLDKQEFYKVLTLSEFDSIKIVLDEPIPVHYDTVWAFTLGPNEETHFTLTLKEK